MRLIGGESHITHNEKVVDLSIGEIFKSNKYNQIIGVTFSINPTFMNNYLSGFEKLELIVGIQENRVQKGANIAAILEKMVTGVKIQDRNDKKVVQAKKEVILSPEFQELWDNIKYKTKYSVSVSTDTLIKECSLEVNKHTKVDRAKIIYNKGRQVDMRSGVVMKEAGRKIDVIDTNYDKLPDIITILQNQTDLTRKTIASILDRSGTLNYFKVNPQKYISQVADIINRKKRLLQVDGIKYTRIGDEAYSCQELFLDSELTGYLSQNLYYLKGKCTISNKYY